MKYEFSMEEMVNAALSWFVLEKIIPNAEYNMKVHVKKETCLLIVEESRK